LPSAKQYKFFITVLLLCCNIHAYSQNRLVDSLKDWISSHPTIDSQYIQTLHRISYRLSENDIKQAFHYYERVSMLSDSLNFTYGKSIALINLALLFSTTGNYEASNSAYFKAIDFAESCGALRAKSVSLNNIADNFNSLNNFEKCREYTLKALELNTHLKAWRGVAINYELLHQCDMKQKLYKNARLQLLKGMPFALQTNESYILSPYYLGFGKLHAVNGEFDSARFYFNKALLEANEENDLRNVYNIYIAETEYLKKYSGQEKIALLDSAYSIAKKTSYLKGVVHSAELLSHAYDNINDDSSIAYYRIFRAANDSMFSVNNRRNVTIRESDWMIKRKEIENAHLQQLSQIQKKELVVKNALVFALLLLLLLMIAVAMVVYSNIESKKKREESFLKQKIAETKMQSLRAQMNPHFIFNCLNSIENFIMRNEKSAASNYLNKFSSLVRIILLSSRSELVPFIKDLEAIQLYVELEQLRFNNKFSYKTNIDSELLNGEYNVPSLLIQPYIENAILHGLSQSEAENLELSLSAVLEGEYIVYTIQDNGIGRLQSDIYKKANSSYYKSLGLEVTKERIDLFNHQYDAESKVEITDLYNEKNEASGTMVKLKIKAV
jgi:hypothetical protein